MIFRSSITYCRRTFAPAVDTARSPFDVVETGYLARDVERLLGCDRDRARTIAHGAAWRMTTFAALARRRPRRGAALIAANVPPPADLSLLRALETNEAPYILALPYTTAAVALLAHLSMTTRRPITIEQTPLTQTLMPLFACEFATPDVLIRRNRTRDERTAGGIIVTFPDHHLTVEGTTRPVTFLGGEFHFSLAEALLYVRGASPLVTLHATESGLVLDTYQAPVDPGAVREQDAQALLDWLAARIESVVRAEPAQVLAWRVIAQRTSSAARLRRIFEGRMLQALIRIAPLPGDLRDWAMTRLRAIEAGYKEVEAA